MIVHELGADDTASPPAGIVVTAGRATITDLGRERGPDVGLPVGGAMDRFAARLANARVGNDDGAAVIEVTLLELSFIAERPLVVATAGAGHVLRIGGVAVGGQTAYSVPVGAEVSVGEIAHGVRVCLAVAGGFDAPSFLGSCAPDPTLGVGLLPTVGDRVGVRGTVWSAAGEIVRVESGRGGSHPAPHGRSARALRVLPGPEFADYGAEGSALFQQEYEMGPDSNHIGMRFTGVTPARAGTGELLSRGVAIGAVEIPSPGHVIVLHRGRGATAGYPVPGVVATADLDVLAQCTPGAVVRFRLADPDELRRERNAREALLDDVRERTRRCLSRE